MSTLSLIIPYFNFLLTEDWLLVFVPAYLLAAFLYFSGELSIRWFKWLFAALGFTLLARALALATFTYLTWAASPPAAYLLPPYQPFSYFLGYSFTHFFASLILTVLFVIAAAVFFWVVGRLRETPRRKLWGKGEEYIFFTGAFLVRWPLVIPYLFFAIVAAIGYVVYLRYVEKKEERFLDVNIVPFFVILVPLLLWLRESVLAYLGLIPLVMPL